MPSGATNYLEDEFIKAKFRTSTVTVRANTTAYSVGDRVQLGTSDLNIYECITAGTSAAAPPTFNTNLGDTTTDSGVTWLTLKHGMPKRPVFIALFTAAPGEAGGGTEVSGGSYARVAVVPQDSNWAATSGGNGQTSNSNEIIFAAPTANWGTVTDMAEMDRSSAGNMEIYGTLTNSRIINNGDVAPKFAVGALTVSLA